jgi:threonine dehydrogenase-like Zn-dependent dehydrogenase
VTGERGSIAIVLVAVIGLIAVLTAALGGVARVVAAQHTAQMAADAAALAAAPVTFRQTNPNESALVAAGRLAVANGGRLVDCFGCAADPSWKPRIVEVTVAVDVDLPALGPSSVSAVAAAEFDPIRLFGSP